MNKKGFTLIELLAVIAIIAILATISVVIVEGTMKKANTNLSKIEKENVKSVARAYVGDNLADISSDLETSGCSTIQAATLENEGYITLDPSKIYEDLIVTKVNNKINVEYPDEVSLNTTCFPLSDDNDYNIENEVLNGASSGSDRNIIIPNGVKQINGGFFTNTFIRSLILPYGLTELSANAFNNNLLTSLVLPDTVTTIGNYAFAHNQLKSLVLPNDLTSISQDCFRNNELKSVTLPSGLKTLAIRAFFKNKLTQINIPEGVITIGANSFGGNLLTEVTIPSSVTTIGGAAFQTHGPETPEDGYYFNPNLTIIHNKTGRAFGWKAILSPTAVTSCTDSSGNIVPKDNTSTPEINEAAFVTGYCMVGDRRINITD